MTSNYAVPVNEFSEVKRSIYGRQIRTSDMILKGLIYLCAGLSIAILIGIMGYVFVRGIPHLSWAFLTTVTSATKGTFGILGNIVNTLYIVVITLLIATPIGVGAAIYLNEYAKPGRVVRIIEFTTETLSGIPSIIFGLFGMVFFGNTLGFKYSILTGALTLTLMILPLITRTTQEALKTVPTYSINNHPRIPETGTRKSTRSTRITASAILYFMEATCWFNPFKMLSTIWSR